MTVGVVVSVGALRLPPTPSLNCQLYLATPPGAVEPVASKLISLPATGVAAKVALGSSPAKVRRCRQRLVWLPRCFQNV